MPVALALTAGNELLNLLDGFVELLDPDQDTLTVTRGQAKPLIHPADSVESLGWAPCSSLRPRPIRSPLQR